MALETQCQTPGAIFHIGITPHGISVTVDMPGNQLANLTKEQASILQKNIHNALEQPLARYFIK